MTAMIAMAVAGWSPSLIHKSFCQTAQIRRSQHAFINPSITVVLRAGSGDHGLPPLASTDGRGKHKFASCWNRNHVCQALLKQAQYFQAMQQAAKLKKVYSMLCTQSSAFSALVDGPEEQVAEVQKLKSVPVVDVKTVQPFLKEEALVELMKVNLPGSPEEISELFSNGAKFTHAVRAIRKATDLKIERWNPADDYLGEVRKMTFRAVCRNPMCPPDTAMTEYQHRHLSDEKTILLFETVQQCHDVPFGSYFEVHVKWVFESVSAASCSLVVKVGAHFKKWCLMQSKIKTGTVNEYKGDAELIVDTARKFLEDAKKLNGGSSGAVAPDGASACSATPAPAASG